MAVVTREVLARQSVAQPGSQPGMVIADTGGDWLGTLANYQLSLS